jgi:hypothetical protein
MIVNRLRGEITADRKLIVRLPKDVTPGAVDVIILPVPSRKSVRRSRRASTHPAFGTWSGRTEVRDAAAYAASLRRQVESRGDGRP